MARGPLIRELIWDPRGSVFDGHYSSKPYGGHQHLHLALANARIMLAALKYAQRLGLTIRENPAYDRVDPVHTKGSWHYQTFPGGRLGMAADISGSNAAQQRLWSWVLQRYGGQGLSQAAGGGGGGAAPARGGGRVAMPQLQPIRIDPPQIQMTDPSDVLARFAPRSATMAATATAPPSMRPDDQLLAELRRQLLGGM